MTESSVRHAPGADGISPVAMEGRMAKIKIFRKDGSPSPYFWSDKDDSDRDRKTVYKQTSDGRKRMRGVHFNAVTNRLRKDPEAS